VHGCVHKPLRTTDDFFQVNDMTCGDCISSLRKALKAADAMAKVKFDLAAHRADIEPSKADAAELSEAIRLAGYAPMQIDGANGSDDRGAASARRGCCCS
jgi:copper chaperone